MWTWVYLCLLSVDLNVFPSTGKFASLCVSSFFILPATLFFLAISWWLHRYNVNPILLSTSPYATYPSIFLPQGTPVPVLSPLFSRPPIPHSVYWVELADYLLLQPQLLTPPKSDFLVQIWAQGIEYVTSIFTELSSKCSHNGWGQGISRLCYPETIVNIVFLLCGLHSSSCFLCNLLHDHCNQ